jgi:hypothetical protein
MSTYQLYPDTSKGPVSCVKRTDNDGSIWCIPFSEDNTDYKKYLEWVAEGNKPKAADKTD